jgi:rRNA maturation RNase YbeY
MDIQISARKRIPGLENRRIRQKLKKVLDDLGCHEGELSILFTNDLHMAELNSRYLGRSGPTNVLAFPMSTEPCPGTPHGILGDVVISTDTALREAEETGETPEETAYRLLIHGLLHLLGYDHEGSSDEARIMRQEEERLLALMELPL